MTLHNLPPIPRPSTLSRAVSFLRAFLWDDAQYEPWATGMFAGFAICSVLDTFEVAGVIPESLQYRASMFQTRSIINLSQIDSDLEETGENAYGADSYTVETALAWRRGEVTTEELEVAAEVVSRYLDLCKRAGRDY